MMTAGMIRYRMIFERTLLSSPFNSFVFTMMWPIRIIRNSWAICLNSNMLICMGCVPSFLCLIFLFYSLLYHYDPVSIVSFLVRYFLLLIIYLKRVRIVSAKT